MSEYMYGKGPNSDKPDVVREIIRARLDRFYEAGGRLAHMLYAGSLDGEGPLGCLIGAVSWSPVQGFHDKCEVHVDLGISRMELKAIEAGFEGWIHFSLDYFRSTTDSADDQWFRMGESFRTSETPHTYFGSGEGFAYMPEGMR